jgi:uncharacterized protein YjbI with pentapeptide repeats
LTVGHGAGSGTTPRLANAAAGGQPTARPRAAGPGRVKQVKSPKVLDDLPFATRLRPFGEDGPDRGRPQIAAGLEPGEDYELVRFAELFTDADATGTRFTECAFSGGAGFDGGRLRRARLSDTWLGETRLVAVDLAESSLTDVWFSGCVLAGVQAFSCIGRRVLLRGCKLDSVNFRDAKLTDVTFDDCVLRDVDFGSARLLRVRFAGSTLVNTDFSHATCRDVDLRGARLGTADAPGIKAGYGNLAGVQIDMPQLMTIAPLLAHHLGLAVTD